MIIRQGLLTLVICSIFIISASCGNSIGYNFDENSWSKVGDLSELEYSAESHGGKRAIKIMSNEVNFQGGVGTEIELEAGTYLYTGWIKGRLNPGSTVRFLATEPDSGECKVLSSSIGEWTYYQSRVRVSKKERIKIIPVMLQGKGDILIDDIKIVPLNDGYDLGYYLIQSVVQREVTSSSSLAIPTLTKRPLIDGESDSEEYLGSYSTTNFFGTSRIEKHLLSSSVGMNVGVYGNSLFVFIKCYEPDIQLLEPSENMWTGDLVAIFLGLDPSRYYQMVVTPDGSLYDEEVIGTKKDSQWSGTWQVKTVKGKDFWASEFEIPLSDFGIEDDTAVEQIVYFNVCRQRAIQQTLQFYSWSNVEGNFHQPDKFRPIVLFAEQAELELVGANFGGPVQLGTTSTEIILSVKNNSEKEQVALIEAASFLGSQQTDSREKELFIEAKDSIELKIPLMLSMPNEKPVTIKIGLKDLGKDEYLPPINFSLQVPTIAPVDFIKEQHWCSVKENYI